MIRWSPTRNSTKSPYLRAIRSMNSIGFRRIWWKRSRPKTRLRGPRRMFLDSVILGERAEYTFERRDSLQSRLTVRVLLTHRSLQNRAGSEVFVRDVARELRTRGHSPVVYSPEPGVIGAEIRRLTVPVINQLSRLGVAPDVIHGHHQVETMAALLAFPGVPAVYFCQDWYRAV